MSEYTFDVDIFKYNILFDNNNVKLIEDMENYGILRNYCKKFNELIEKSEILEKEFTPRRIFFFCNFNFIFFRGIV